jgi:hypothetical protein
MNTHDELEELLGRELHGQVDGMNSAPLGLRDVQGRARSIRRTRVAASTIGAAAAVAAVVVPLVLVMGPDRGGHTLPPAVSPTVTQSADPADPHPPLSFSLGQEIHPVDGAPFTPELDATEGLRFFRFGDQWVVGTYGSGDGNGLLLSVVGDTGTVVRSFEIAESNIVSNEQGTAVAWVDQDDAVRVLAVGMDEPAVLTGELPAPSNMTTLVALRGDDCAEGDCEVLFQSYVDDGSGTRTEIYRMSMDGQPEQILDTVMNLSDVSPDGTLATGLISMDNIEQTSCSAVVEIATGKQRWKTCEAGNLRFSPDGEHVLGSDPYLDGANHSLWVVLDAADGSEVRRGEGIVFDEAWDTDTSWLVIAGESGTEKAWVQRYELGTKQPTVIGEPSDRQITGLGYQVERR